MGLKKYTKKETVQSIVKDFNLGFSVKELSIKYSLAAPTVYYYLSKHKVTFKSFSESRREYFINENYFDVIDTEDKAYFLGLIYADGCLVLSNNTLSISLQESDKHILEKLTELLQPNKPLIKILPRQETHKIQYRICISNKHIVQQIQKIGVFPNKSFKIRLPTNEQVPKELLHHFIRGYFDGDGCISIYNIKNKYKSCSVSIISNEYFLKELQEIFINEIGLNKTKIQKDNRHNNIQSMVYGGMNNCKKIKEYLYKSATIYLNRKYEKFKEI